MCHRLSALALAALTCLSAGACASGEDWSVTDSRTCAPGSPPRACVVREPDYGHVLGAGDVELLPGECAVAGADGRGGLLRVTTRDGRGQTRSRWVSAPKGRQVLVRIDEDGRVAVERARCDQRPIAI